MLQKTRGIALSYIKYRETSIIARIFTSEFGMQSYVVNHVRSNKARTKIALFQPLTLLDLVVYFHPKKDINRISEIKSSFTFHSIPFDIKKTSITLFVTEFMNKILREEGANPSLYEYLENAIIAFDRMETGAENFHLHFLMKLTSFMGIQPESSRLMMDEVGILIRDERIIDALQVFIDKDFTVVPKLSRNERNTLLNYIIDFYRFHLGGLGEIKSLPVLKETLG
jgi:DNA repair protein RecO (recombination protein O)